MSKVMDTLTGKLSEQKKLGITCASLMTRMCGGCVHSLKVRLHREPNPEAEACKDCIRVAYKVQWKEECVCIA